MFTIGQIAARTGTKVPTVRYYEGIGLLPEAERTAGGQRRYDRAALDRLGFIRHARALGFGLEDIRALLDIEGHGDAHAIAERQLRDVRDRMARLARLESELARIVGSCAGGGGTGPCRVLEALGDHDACAADH
ncbi:MerR family transcriptional regulator [Jannaschia pohangensis]|uniref:DNA-binding transcriptional regulator, MerR family n=1 Tax=Jannaschia pohangensis TaxID=390807 RepID=A0A1I3IGX3_9RHOB|nr:helix-turn-helix domain-containing protein [Jannaschia pohangensis]SFI47043.1 DNA-binding transcriptional regulator, MerR family [Jannaschia pohangensis]